MRNLLITTIGEYNHARVWKEGLCNYDVITIDYNISGDFKYPGIYKELTARKRLNYDYYFMPDEDILLTSDDINKIFALMYDFGIDLAQPSIEKSDVSFLSWEQFVHKDGLDIIYTDFIEVMCPCFSKRCLDLCLETLPKSISGWGLDLVWASIAKKNNLSTAILNGVVAKHTRPVGKGTLYAVLKSNGLRPSQERKRLMREYGISSIEEFIH